jgi:hypothetical protein
LNLRKGFLEILAKAGLKPWPRLFHNLRGSLQTDLANRFPLHVVTAWIGNSEKVAQAHYLKVTGDHIAAATGKVGQQQENANEIVGRVGQVVGHSLAESKGKQQQLATANPTKTRAIAKTQCSAMAQGTPGRTRTYDPLIKSQLL